MLKFDAAPLGRPPLIREIKGGPSTRIRLGSDRRPGEARNPMDLNQVTIEVRDFRESVEFYTKLGLKLIVSAGDAYARFELPSGSSTLSFYQSDQPAIGNTALYFEVDDVDRRYAELHKSGIRFDSTPVDRSWMWREAHFTDPTGNKLCLYHAGLNRRFPPWRLET